MLNPGDGLRTSRLQLRRFTGDDLDTLYRMYADPAVMRHAGGVLDHGKASLMIRERILDYYALHPGLGIWATIESASGACVGLHLLNHIRGAQHIQIGYLLFPRFWSLGYATEMAREVLHHGLQTLRLPQVTAIVDLDNLASQRVLRKIGMQRDGARHFAAYGPQPLAWFTRDVQAAICDREH